MLIVAPTDHAGSMKCMCYLIYMHARFKLKMAHNGF